MCDRTLDLFYWSVTWLLNSVHLVDLSGMKILLLSHLVTIYFVTGSEKWMALPFEAVLTPENAWCAVFCIWWARADGNLGAFNWKWARKTEGLNAQIMLSIKLKIKKLKPPTNASNFFLCNPYTPLIILVNYFDWWIVQFYVKLTKGQLYFLKRQKCPYPWNILFDLCFDTS